MSIALPVEIHPAHDVVGSALHHDGLYRCIALPVEIHPVHNVVDSALHHEGLYNYYGFSVIAVVGEGP